jgi:flagellar biogenesis protein FliO
MYVTVLAATLNSRAIFLLGILLLSWLIIIFFSWIVKRGFLNAAHSILVTAAQFAAL